MTQTDIVERISDKKLADMLFAAEHCRYGEFAVLVDQRAVFLALSEITSLRQQVETLTRERDRAPKVFCAALATGVCDVVGRAEAVEAAFRDGYWIGGHIETTVDLAWEQSMARAHLPVERQPHD